MGGIGLIFEGFEVGFRITESRRDNRCQGYCFGPRFRLRSCCLENNLSVDTQVQLFFCSWPFSCTPKKKAQKEGRLPARRTALQAGRSSAAGAAFPRIAPGVDMCVCVLRAFRDSRGEGAGGNRAEKPLPSAPNALEAKRVRGRVRITAQVCQRNYFHHHGCSRGRMTTVLKPPAVFARLQKRRPVCLLAPACACPHADRRARRQACSAQAGRRWSNPPACAVPGTADRPVS